MHSHVSFPNPKRAFVVNRIMEKGRLKTEGGRLKEQDEWLWATTKIGMRDET